MSKDKKEKKEKVKKSINFSFNAVPDEKGVIKAIIAVFVCIFIIALIFVLRAAFKNTEETEIPTLTNQPILEVASDYKGHWSEKYMVDMVNRGLMTGTSSTTLDPDGKVTRAQFVITLYKMDNGKIPINKEKSIKFTDVLDNFYYTDAINWGSSNGIINGISPTEFVPNHLVSREQAMFILYAYDKKVNKEQLNAESGLPYKDADMISDFAKEGVEWAYSKNLVDFWDKDELEPHAELQRGELAALVYNYINQ